MYLPPSFFDKSRQINLAIIALSVSATAMFAIAMALAINSIGDFGSTGVGRMVDAILPGDQRTENSLALGIMIPGFIVFAVCAILGAFRIHRLFDRLQEEMNDVFDLALTDSICGLANKRAFEVAMEEEMAAEDRVPFAVLMMDLAKFKAINDVHGHDAGDEVLRVVGRRIEQIVGDKGVVARLGGDEFAAMLSGRPGMLGSVDISEEIVSAVQAPISVAGKDLYTGTSVGIARWPDDGESPQQLMVRADMAMYLAKHSDEENYCFYEATMGRDAEMSLQLANDIREGLERGEFQLLFQPQFDKQSAQLKGIELLMQWQHPINGTLQPNQFLPAASEHNLIIDLSEWAIERSLEHLHEWSNAGISLPALCLNIHPDQLRDAQHIYWLEDKHKRAGNDFDKLVMEIDESCLTGRGSDRVPEILDNWYSQGMKIHLDNFGTGYASLSHLKDLSVHGFKIAPSFVRDVLYDDTDEALVVAMSGLGRSLDLDVVACGVNNSDQMDKLLKLGCTSMQGDFLCPALAPDELRKTLENQDALNSERQNTERQSITA